MTSPGSRHVPRDPTMTIDCSEADCAVGNPLERPRWLAVICLVLIGVGSLGAALGNPVNQRRFAVIGSIHANAGLWDYAVVDAQSQRLYLADAGVLALDLATGRITPQLIHGTLTHGIVSLGDGVMAVADGARHRVVIFDGKTGRILHEIQTGAPAGSENWHDPDALVFDEKTNTLIAVNGDSGTLALIDWRKSALVGMIRVGGKLEFAAAGHGGALYVNVASQNELAVISVSTRKFVRHFPLPGCNEPTGLAYDQKLNLTISACSNGKADFINPDTGMLRAQVDIGTGCDAVELDRSRQVAYFPAGDSGILTIVAVNDWKSIHVIQTLRTALGVRLGAVNPKTGFLYLPAVNYDMKAPRVKLPGLPPLLAPLRSSFRFLMVAPVR